MTAIRIAVDGVEIPASAVHAEMQYHPARNASTAMQEAAQALVVRELLLAEARRQGLAIDEASPDNAIEALLAAEIRMPAPDEATCRRYYDANRSRFHEPDLFDAEHILLASAADDHAARIDGKDKARDLIDELVVHPERFAELAARWSACPSKDEGGRLGEIGRGGAVPEFETFLMSLEPGELCRAPVESRYGVHVVRLRAKRVGKPLSFEEAKDAIARFLGDTGWQNSVRLYIGQLVDRARIEGIELPAAGAN
ncbi:MAG: peptidylprolyl isomerase [Reyranellales bacterium]